MNEGKITIRAFVLGLLLCVAQTFVACYFSNRENIYLASTQMPALPFLLLTLFVAAINPLCRLIRVVRRFTKAELLTIFMMLFVSAGIGLYGLGEQIVPLMNGLFNPSWNNQQSNWSLHVVPLVEESFFVSEEGIRDAARTRREAHLRKTEIETIHRAAQAAAHGQRHLEVVMAALEDVRRDASGDAAEHAMAVKRAESALERARNAERNAGARWERVRPDATMTPDAAVRAYEPLLREAEQRLALDEKELDRLQAKAFEKVELFRRGLPREMRAVPGLFPDEHDTFDSYTARVRRLVQGRRSLAALRGGSEALPDVTAFRTGLGEAIELLEPLVRAEPLDARKGDLDERLAAVRSDISAQDKDLTALYEQSRTVTGAEIKRLERRIESVNAARKALAEKQETLRGRAEGISQEVAISARVTDVIGQLRGLAAQADDMPAGELDEAVKRVMPQYRLFDASLARFLVGDVPWSDWVRPLLNWAALLVLTYLVLMTLNVLIFRQWAFNEKLIYPLAELPEHLVGVHDETDGACPQLFKTGLFWVGAAISGSVLGWNLLVGSGVIPGLAGIDLLNRWSGFIGGTAFEGLIPRTRSAVFFTMIGLSFLIPRKISFSLWFFHVLFMLQLLILVWTGHGTNMNSFPKEWISTLNFRTAEGGGALVIFSAVVLFKCRRYLLCCLFPSSVANLESDERVELRVSSFLFL
ncbi:MAG: hypothetical protein HQ559_11095, partial [Lentisphaerae bacterium]|nr:hypothetical protein [Lentisphaerota bacterium]